jgi:dipeptidyl aminopeptidase/acylaminoacyl peptidase
MCRYYRWSMLPLVLVQLVLLGPAQTISHAWTWTTSPGDGTLLEQSACPPDPRSYDRWMLTVEQNYAAETASARGASVAMLPFEAVRLELPSREEFDTRRAYEGFECSRIVYLSDGLRVTGYLWKPRDTAGRRLPLVIYNRGGNRGFGQLTHFVRDGFYSYVANGFVVLASQYRGNDGGEGQEEFGGADVRDVLNLLPVAASFGYVDMNNVFVQGDSRGGMMTYLALKQGLPANAAVVVSGVGDLLAWADERAEIVDGVYKQLIPEFDERPVELLRERSVVHWAHLIQTPLLLLHGTADWRAPTASQALGVAERLQEHGKTYELVIYADDDHGLSLNWRDRDRRIIEWFKKHLR